MPIEIALHPGHEAEVRQVYEELTELALQVDAGELPLAGFGARLEATKERTFEVRCLVRVESPDGRGRCLDYLPAVQMGGVPRRY
ncbi:hypothetical protein EZJ19_03635 [Parasulfuritortus cantonensis]|uniref:Uncharacterized protein n=1 Tax=Parasulfuritortus cantonensis TaxID=2528202 RepID=A0A4R1BKZ2_9PROT|nr:hypothetical protein [Parasulfuritortus cantonensis]TCJ18009.1 hypothetical protein EZJ19_03635 [Parasulfuritortus cantonensis]